MKAQDILGALACGRAGCACVAAARRGAGDTHCPAHDDERPSLSVSATGDTVLVHCQAGCAQDAVVSALRERSLWPSSEPRSERRREVAAYPYTDETGALLYEVVRYEPKSFLQRCPDEGGYVYRLDGVRRVLYNLPEVLSVARAGWRVYVTEGEKDADMVTSLGLMGTTAAGGAGKWRDDYADALTGAEVVVIADKDEPGRAHAKQVAASCARTARVVKVVEVPGDHTKDVSDWLSAGGTKDSLEALADAAPAWPARSAEPAPFEVVTLEDFAAVEEPGAAALIGVDGDALIPEGSDVLVYGTGGAGKTTLMLDLACHLAAGNDWLGMRVALPVRVLLIENEGPRPLFRTKVLQKLAAWRGSALAGRVGVLDHPWAAFLLTDADHREWLASTIRVNAIDVVIVGPITAIGMTEAGTIAEVRAFMGLLGEVRAQAGRTVTFGLVHHENKAGTISGAWEGVGDTVLHVSQQGQGFTRVHVQKARFSSTHHGTTLNLAWDEGEGFRRVEQPERTDADIESDLLAAASANAGGGWSVMERAVSGKTERKRAARDRLLADGRLVNTGTEARMRLWHVDDPVRPVELRPIGARLGRDPEPAPASNGAHPVRAPRPSLRGGANQGRVVPDDSAQGAFAPHRGGTEGGNDE